VEVSVKTDVVSNDDAGQAQEFGLSTLRKRDDCYRCRIPHLKNNNT
jgi:hypothetical protein